MQWGKVQLDIRATRYRYKWGWDASQGPETVKTLFEGAPKPPKASHNKQPPLKAEPGPFSVDVLKDYRTRYRLRRTWYPPMPIS